MPDSVTHIDLDTSLSQLETGAGAGKLSAGAVENIRKWLTEPRYSRYAPQVAEHLAEGKWQQLDDAFWTVIPFGTGGRRGRMYPIGSNAINDRTIGESAQGLADYMKETHAGELSCAIAYDTRHRSRHFAELCASIMVGNGLKVFFLDDYRSTPELSYLVRFKACTCGIMVTASHNPPSDNAVKVYGSNGGQLVPPHDKGVIDRVGRVAEITVADFDQAVEDGQVVACTEEIDTAYIREVTEQSYPGPRELSVVYSPLHGVGESSVRPALHGAGFQEVEIFELHRQPNGDFPNVAGHVSNPENPEVFVPIIERAEQTGADLILATDPDCDRMGAAARLNTQAGAEWKTFNGNQLGALLADYVLSMRQAAGTLSADHYVVKTLVTSDLVRRIAESYGVKCLGNVHVGYKWIVEIIDQVGTDKFVFAAEESHGYLVGQYARDKDGAVACMLMAEVAAKCKSEGKSPHQKLDELYRQHGYHAEHLLNVRMEGSDGMQRMKTLMEKFRTDPPATLGGVQVECVRDFQNQTILSPDGNRPLDAPVGNMLIFDLSETGSYVAVRPSGTEPKVKFYSLMYVPPGEAGLEQVRARTDELIRGIETDLAAFAESV